MKEYYVCLACGKFSEDKFGKNTHGWDVSCYVNSIKVPEDRIVWNGNKTRVIEVKD